jgi:hypothetical protein
MSSLQDAQGLEHFYLQQEYGQELFNNLQKLDVDRSRYFLGMSYVHKVVDMHFPYNIISFYWILYCTRI